MNSQFGSSYLELLVSLFILSVMLLGLDALQITALRQAKSTYYFNTAMQQLEGMRERLRVIKEGDRQAQLMIWNQQNKDILPQGRGWVEGQYPSYTLTLCWNHKIGESPCLRMATKC